MKIVYELMKYLELSFFSFLKPLVKLFALVYLDTLPLVKLFALVYLDTLALVNMGPVIIHVWIKCRNLFCVGSFILKR